MADEVEHSFQSQNVRLHQEIKHNLPTDNKVGEYFQFTKPKWDTEPCY